MDAKLQKEEFSVAYLRTIAAAAGFLCNKSLPDIDGVDWQVAAAGGLGTVRSPKIEVQLKCTARDLLDDKNIRFPLEVEYYDKLRAENYQVPRILAVVVVPKDVEDWVCHSEEELAMRHCGYWVSLYGKPESSNQSNVTVYVPRAQMLSVDSLKQMMERVGNGGLP